MTFVPVIPFNKYSIGDFARLFTLAACKKTNLAGDAPRFGAGRAFCE